MKILLTNDDGIFAPGLKALGDIFTNSAEVYVIAPEGERSAIGHGITVHSPLRVEVINDWLPGFNRAWSVSGTPADCVKLAVEELLQELPDLLISGINRGANLGTDVLYSGTVSAAIEGMIYEIPSIAVSMVDTKTMDYHTSAKLVQNLVNHLHTRRFPQHTLLNMNIPDIQPNELQGIRVTKLGHRRYCNMFDRRVDPRGRTYYWMAGECEDLNAGPETDILAVSQKFISITPIHFDLTNYGFMGQVSQWLSDLEI